MATNKDKVVKRNDGVNGTYSKETLDNGSTIELLSRRNPDESVTYTERFITPQDTSYYIYNNTTPHMDRHVIGGKYVTPTKYNNMGWLGRRIIAGVRPESWDAKFDSYQEPVDSFQQGGEAPSNDTTSFLENLPYGRHNVNEHNKLVEMGKRFGDMIPGLVKPVPMPNKYQPAVPPVKMPMHKQDTSDIKPVPMPMYPGQLNDQMPAHRDNKFMIPQEMYQEGGNLPSDDQQQQLFVAIITDMAATLGVEPSQELAEAVITAFENNDDSQGLLTLFTKTKDKFMNETGLFREGGKMHAFVEKFKCGGKAKKTSKKQMGGEVEDAGAGYITTPVNDRQMRRNWREATGGTRREARQVQRDLTNYIENQGGISHRGARNSAAVMMGDPQRFAQPQESRILGGVSTPTLNVPAPQLGTPSSIEHNYDNFDFNKAFGRARRNGEDTFMWRGKEYTTELAPEPAVQTQIEPRVGTPMMTPTAPGNGQYYDPSLDPMFKFGEWLAGGEKGRARRAARRAQNAENMRILSETGVPRHVEPISRFKDYR